MTPLYAGIGGVVRELTEMHTGINGVVTPLTEMWAGVGGVERQIFSAGTPVGNLSVGDIVQLNENGVAQDYLCVHQGLPSSMYDSSCDGTWLLRRWVDDSIAWDSSDINKLETSDIQSWLNSTMLGKFDENVRGAIKQVKIPYRYNGGTNGTDRTGANGLSCKVFLLSGYEVGWTTSDNSQFPVDGAKLAYFISGTDGDANNQRATSTSIGVDTSWWLRSPDTESKDSVWQVDVLGEYFSYVARGYGGVRPCIILPQNFVL